LLETCAAALRKQSRHRQSLPSTGIGSRAVSSAHQHGPDRLQVNSVPQPEQARRREGGGLSDRLVMQRTALLRGFNSGFLRTALCSAANHKLEAAKHTPKQSIRPKESNRQLNYEGRDLAPTTDLRAVMKGVLHDHLGVADACWRNRCFPIARR
jgi:hypothetical protein